MRSSPKDVLEMVEAPGFLRYDQWQVQILAKILLRSRVHIYSSGLSHHEASAAFLNPIDDVEEALVSLAGEHRARTGRQPRICVLPQGPQTVPYLRH